MKRFTTCLFVLATCLTLGCAQMRYAQTNLGQAIHDSSVQSFPWGEVVCGDGTVCAEVEVVAVDAEDRDGGRVDVTLHNRTGEAVAVQIGLEILAANGSRLDSTQFENVPMPPRQNQSWVMKGVNQKGAKIRVILRALL